MDVYTQILIVILIAGAAICYAGYRLFKHFISVIKG